MSDYDESEDAPVEQRRNGSGGSRAERKRGGSNVLKIVNLWPLKSLLAPRRGTYGDEPDYEEPHPQPEPEEDHAWNSEVPFTVFVTL